MFASVPVMTRAGHLAIHNTDMYIHTYPRCIHGIKGLGFLVFRV